MRSLTDAARENVAKVAGQAIGAWHEIVGFSSLNETIGKVTENFDKFEFGVAGHIYKLSGPVWLVVID